MCSESHFSILFGLQLELLRDWRAERLFDLYYYDGLANQQEQIRLTIGATPASRLCAFPGEPPDPLVRETGHSRPLRAVREQCSHTCMSGLGGQRASVSGFCRRGPELCLEERMALRVYGEAETMYIRAQNTLPTSLGFIL